VLLSHRDGSPVDGNVRAREHHRLRLAGLGPSTGRVIALAVAIDSGPRRFLDVSTTVPWIAVTPLGADRLHSGYQHGSLRPARDSIGTCAPQA
jgi:alpha-beta hydrolase superfamily lysophospholipase